MKGYWKDLGQPHKYLAAHHDVLTDDLGVLGDPDWPILGHQQQRAGRARPRRRPGRPTAC